MIDKEFNNLKKGDYVCWDGMVGLAVVVDLPLRIDNCLVKFLINDIGRTNYTYHQDLGCYEPVKWEV